MLTRRNLAAVAVAVVLVVAGIAAYTLTRPDPDAAVSRVLMSEGGGGAGTAQAADAAKPLPDIVLGNPDAPVTIIEYASMSCPHCARFHETTFKELKAQYIDTGKVKFVLREFPLDPWATAVSMLARCSGNFYPTIDLFFATQRQWAVQGNVLGEIEKIAKQAGISGDKLRSCLSDQALLDGINAVKDYGLREMKVEATPTLYLDGEKIEGDRSIGALKKLIDPKLPS